MVHLFSRYTSALMLIEEESWYVERVNARDLPDNRLQVFGEPILGRALVERTNVGDDLAFNALGDVAMFLPGIQEVGVPLLLGPSREAAGLLKPDFPPVVPVELGSHAVNAGVRMSFLR
jgi:hypothetical protein